MPVPMAPAAVVPKLCLLHNSRCKDCSACSLCDNRSRSVLPRPGKSNLTPVPPEKPYSQKQKTVHNVLCYVWSRTWPCTYLGLAVLLKNLRLFWTCLPSMETVFSSLCWASGREWMNDSSSSCMAFPVAGTNVNQVQSLLHWLLEKTLKQIGKSGQPSITLASWMSCMTNKATVLIYFTNCVPCCSSSQKPFQAHSKATMAKHHRPDLS